MKNIFKIVLMFSLFASTGEVLANTYQLTVKNNTPGPIALTGEPDNTKCPALENNNMAKNTTWTKNNLTCTYALTVYFPNNISITKTVGPNNTSLTASYVPKTGKYQLS